jgi:3-oxoacyl-[acyl-carrier-protein] synthase-3
MYSRIAGTGSYLPEKIVTNADLERLVDTSDEWIRTRTGIKQRHVAAEGETTTDLAEHAARRAMADAGVTAQDIDLICVGTTTPDLVFPNVGTLLQDRLGIHGCPAFSLEAACTGFVYALGVADKFVRLGEAKCALVVGAETLTRIVDWSDRGTCDLWRRRGRGSTAAVERAGHHQHTAAFRRQVQGSVALPGWGFERLQAGARGQGGRADEG